VLDLPAGLAGLADGRALEDQLGACAPASVHEGKLRLASPCSGSIKVTLSGGTISATMTEADPKWTYKPGYSRESVQSSMVGGKVWSLTYTRKQEQFSGRRGSA
jgi:hypothetical protein